MFFAANLGLSHIAIVLTARLHRHSRLPTVIPTKGGNQSLQVYTLALLDNYRRGGVAQQFAPPIPICYTERSDD